MLLCNLFCILLSTAVTLRRDKSIMYNRIASIIFIVITSLSLYSLNFTTLTKAIALFGGSFSITSTSFIFQIFIYGVSFIIIALSGVFARKIKEKVFSRFSLILLINNKTDHFKIIEYSLIILFILIGATFLTISNDVVSLFISIELQSYGLYLLIALYRNSELSTNAALTYFLLGGLSSCFILLGTSLLYTNSGASSLESLYVANKVWDATKNTLMYFFETNYINYAIIVMIAGFLFKISSAPFHFWSPDVYDAIPTIVTTFVAIIPKISILTFIYTIVHFTTNNGFSLDYDWRYILLISSLLSLIVGSVLGLNQSRIKRLYAYSTISHIGFILLALSINNVESTQAFMFYLMQYSLSNLNAFILLLIIGYSLYLYKDSNLNGHLIEKTNSPLQLISQLKGYYQFNPMIAISLTITIYSFVGIPPLLGFFAKQMVLSAALNAGLIFMALIAIITSVISAVYYLNVIKQIFFDKFTYSLEPLFKNIINNYYVKLSDLFTIIISILTLIILLFMLQPHEWLSTTHLMSLLSFNL